MQDKFLALEFLRKRLGCNLTPPYHLPRGYTSFHSNQQCVRARFMALGSHGVVLKFFAQSDRRNCTQFYLFICDSIFVFSLLNSWDAIMTALCLSLHFVFISVKCLNCKGVSDTFDPYLDITLEIKVSWIIVVTVKFKNQLDLT